MVSGGMIKPLILLVLMMVPAAAQTAEDLQAGAEAWVARKNGFTPRELDRAIVFNATMRGFLFGIGTATLGEGDGKDLKLGAPVKWMYETDDVAESFAAFMRRNHPNGFKPHRNHATIASYMLRAWYLDQHPRSDKRAREMSRRLVIEYYEGLDRDGNLKPAPIWPALPK
jgi:hypothetical protein